VSGRSGWTGVRPGRRRPIRIVRTPSPRSFRIGAIQAKVIADRYAVLISRALSRTTIVPDRRSRSPSASRGSRARMHRAPVPDPLTGPPQQRQQRRSRSEQAASINRPRPPARPAGKPPRNALPVLRARPRRTNHDQASMRPSIGERPTGTDTADHPHPEPRSRSRRSRNSKTMPTRTAGDSPSSAGAERAHLAPVRERDDVLAATRRSTSTSPTRADRSSSEMRYPNAYVRCVYDRAQHANHARNSVASPAQRPARVTTTEARPARRTQIHTKRKRSRTPQPHPRR